MKPIAYSAESMGAFIEIVSGHAQVAMQHKRVDQIREVLRSRASGHSPVYFRGHGNIGWDPIPQIDRPEFASFCASHFGHNRQKMETRMLDEFKRTARPFLSVPPSDGADWEWLAIAQHHGLATRLLDWTDNPLVALFFAIHSSPDCDAAIWIYAPHDIPVRMPATPWDVKQVLIYRPPHVARRISAQSGVFSVHGDALPVENWPGVAAHIRVPATRKLRIAKELHNLGVNRATL